MVFSCAREGEGCKDCESYMYNVEYGCYSCYARINAFDAEQRFKRQLKKQKDQNAGVAQLVE